MITHYDIRHAVLERNPYFHEWSHDAQPDGYPDRIVWRLFKKPGQAISTVEHGTADWLYTFTGLVAQQTHEIETNYAAQIHPSAYPATDLLDIEPNSPLGRDHLARQAIAHAIDRPRLGSMIELGSSLVTTCQLIPPNFPGYRPYCPYNLEPALAEKLVHRSRSYGKPVAVFSWAGPTAGRYVVELLNTLGFRARLLPADELGYPIGVPDVELTGWAMDYLGASDFIQVWPAPLTASELNDARRKQGESQYQGTRAWAAADKRVADFAMVIPLAAGSALGFTSKRVGNYQFAPVIGNSPIIDQMWVR
jgi:peptide/nickel transport system substrate-binding protein